MQRIQQRADTAAAPIAILGSPIAILGAADPKGCVAAYTAADG